MPAAIIAINAIDFLARLLLHQAEQVRGCAAIALGYLSYTHTAERQLLNRYVILLYIYKNIHTCIESDVATVTCIVSDVTMLMCIESDVPW